MPTELGLYVLIGYLVAWIFLTICGMIIELHNNSSKRHDRYDGHYT